MSEQTELTFENAMNMLESIVRELETGSITLDDTLTKFEEGIRLLNFCQNQLAEAEQKVAVLTEKGPNNIKLETWNPEGEKNE